MTTKPDMLLWHARGVYIPRDFANCFTDRAKHVTGVSDEYWAILEAGPDHEQYWDVWTDVCDNAIITDTNGVKFRLYHNSDLWFVPDGMVWCDDEDAFMWPEDIDTDESDEIKSAYGED